MSEPFQISLPLTSSAAGSPARTFPPRASAPASKARAPASGANSAASSRTSRRGSSSSRTSPAASVDGCRRCGAICTCSVTVRLPSRFLPSTSERPTAVRACSWLLPTPTATPYGSTNNGSPHDGKGTASLETLAIQGLLPTPCARDASRGGWNQGTDQRSGRPLTEVIDGAIRGLLPTPTVARNFNRTREIGDRHGLGLAPVAAPAGPLSPRFVEWLMGFPDGWTDCDPLAMPLFPSALRQSDG